MQSNESNKRKGSVGSFQDTFSRLTFFTVVASIIVLFTPVAPAVRPLVPSALGYTLFTWGLVCGLPLAWRHKKVWGPVILVVLAAIFRKSKQAAAVIPALPTIDEVKSAIQPVLPPAAPATIPSAVLSVLPAPFDLLPENPHPTHLSSTTPEQASKLINSAIQLAGISFEGTIEVIAIDSGPTLETVHFHLPPRVQMSAIKSKLSDIATHLNMVNSLDMVPSRFPSAVGFVMRKEKRNFVYMRDLVPAFLEYSKKAVLPIMLGMDMEGKPLFSCLTEFPHLLLAGTTGSGKSVQLNTMAQSLLLYNHPDRCKIIMIDPKKVEFNDYQGYPHLLMPVVTDPRRASLVLKKVVVEMDRRYEEFSHLGVKNITHYNSKSDTPMHYLVVIIDELADLMMVAAGDIEESIVRLVQLARAAGIHLVVGTQRPSVDVISGLIKSNLPTRMAFKMNTGVDYRTVMDRGGPSLQGKGDGVFVLSGGQDVRFQSAAISTSDEVTVKFIEDVRKYWHSQVMHDDRAKQASMLEDDEKVLLRVPIHPPAPETIALHLSPPASSAPAISLEKAPERLAQVPTPAPPESPAPPSDSLSITPFDMDDQLEEVEDSYSTALAIASKEGGVNVDMLKLRMGITYEAALHYMGQLHDAGLLGDYVDGRRSYIGDQTMRLSEEELYEAVKRQILSTGKISSEGLSKQFTIQKQKMIGILKQLAEDGVLNRPETNGSSYTIAWSDKDIEFYLHHERTDDLPY